MLSFAITAYNETIDTGRQLRIIECIQGIQDHEAIDEIVVVDDFSDDYDALAALIADEPKVTLHRNPYNYGAFVNKIEAVALCHNEWVITCDSDNCMDRAFVDRIVSLDRLLDVRYCPAANEWYDYTSLVGVYKLSNFLPSRLDERLKQILNQGNQTVHRGAFMEVFEKYRGQQAELMFPDITDKKRPKTWREVFNACDATFSNYLWLMAGNRLQVVQDLVYSHQLSGPTSNWCKAHKSKEQLNTLLCLRLRSNARFRRKYPDARYSDRI